jgi:DNA modification methylase
VNESAAITEVLSNNRQWHVETTDAIAGLRSLPDACVQCVVTSPPYWGLRDYGVEPSIWGGDAACEHEWGDTLRSDKANGFRGPNGHAKNEAPTPPKAAGTICLRCNAWRGCYGLEPTPAIFVANTVTIFRDVRRVLRDDGTLWLNIGDSWNAYNGGSGPGGWNDARDSERPHLESGYGLRCKSLKPKDLCGIPWRVALALQDDGWYLRQDIIWSKPNGMPESVRDRCTKAHEYVFLLTKSERYYFDRLAIGEPNKEQSLARLGRGVADGNKNHNGAPGQEPHSLHQPRKPLRFVATKAEGYGVRVLSGNEWTPSDLANRRSVWNIAVGTYRGAHFAVMPDRLAELCLKAGTAVRGCCSECGAPWQRVTESERVATRPGDGSKVHGPNSRMNKSRDPRHPTEHETKAAIVTGNRDPKRHVTRTATTGWQPGCQCDAETIPCLTLDTFNGAGTTGKVAAKGLGLRYIGFELNPEFADMARKRIARGLDPEPPPVAIDPSQRTLFTDTP